MKISPKEEKFLKVALRLGYLNPDQVSAICAACEAGVNITQYLMKHGYLTPQQVSQVLKVAASDYHPRLAAPQYKTTLRHEDEAEKRGESKEGSGESTLDILSQQVVRGKLWGDFEVLEEIGRGGMGIVYKARHRTHGIIALKIMLAGSEEQNRRFVREAKAHLKLSHPNIMPVYAAGQERGNSYIAMKYVEGETFADLLEKEGVPLETRLDVLIKICRALQHAHDNKVLHRDIKPSNILLSQDGEPFLSDFGLVKMLDMDTQLTQTGQTLGTPFYMSPEQVQAERKKISYASDIYAIGVVLYETITGKLPFVAETIPALYHKIVVEDPVLPCVHNPDIPPALQAICLKAIEKIPALRYPTASALAQDLLRFRKEKPVQALHFDIRRTFYRGYRYLARSPWLFACIIIALTAGIIVLFWPSGQDWKPHWKAAQKSYKEERYIEALKHLDNIRPPYPEKVLELREKVYEKIGKVAGESFKKKDYQRAIGHLEVLPQSPEWLRMRVEILERQGEYEEMRLTLSRLSELKPSAEDLGFMGNKSLESGYFEDAAQYFIRALNHRPDSPLLKKRLAQTMLYQGRYRQAKVSFRQLNPLDAEVAVALSMICYCQGLYPEALEEIAKIAEPSLTPSLKAQVLFVKACAEWRLLEKDLSRWTWLSGEEIPEVQCKKLKEIEGNFKEALARIETSDKTRLETALYEDISLYLKAIVLEQGEGTESLIFAIPEDMATGPQIFFRGVIIRYLIRRQRWQEAREMCDAAVEDFPWIASFYHLRSLARFHLDDISGSLADVDQAIILDKWDFIPIENMSLLMFSRMTQQEYNEYGLVLGNRFVFRQFPPLPQLILDKFLEEFRENSLQAREFSESKKERTENWEAMLKTALETDSPAVFELAAEILANQYENSALQSRLRRLQEDIKGDGTRVGRLLYAMEQKRNLMALAAMEELLLKYAVLGEEHYVIQVYRMGKEGEDLLQQILRDPKRAPLVRLLAARMLTHLMREPLFKALAEMANSAEYPLNLLAAAALKEAAYSIALPEVPREWLFSEEDPESACFYRVLLALYLSPNHNPKLATFLLEDREEIVSLCVAYNLHRYLDLPHPISLAKVEERLIALMGSKDPYIRATACRVFWDFSEIGIDRADPEKEREEYRNQCWEQYHGVIPRILGDPEMKVQFAAMSVLIGDAYFLKGKQVRIRTPKAGETSSLPEILERVREFYDKGSYFMKFWSAVVLSFFDRKENVWQMIEDPTTPYFIRMACIRGIFESKQASFQEILSLAVGVLQGKEEGKASFKQSALFTIGWNFTSGLMPQQFSQPIYLHSFRNLVEENVKDPNPGVQRAAIASLLWCGTAANIETVKPYLKNSNVHIQRAAAATLAGLTLRTRSARIPQLQDSLRREAAHIRKAAAYGYADMIRQEASLDYGRVGGVEYEEIYDLYLLNFQYALTKKSAAELKTWELGLQSAAELDPCFEYYYEAALVSQKIESLEAGSHQYLDARAKLQIALDLAKGSGGGNTIAYHKVRALFSSGEIFVSIGEDRQAQAAFQSLLEEYPFHGRAHFYLGRDAADRGDLTTAREHFWQFYLCESDLFLSWIATLQKGKEVGEDIYRQFH